MKKILFGLILLSNTCLLFAPKKPKTPAAPNVDSMQIDNNNHQGINTCGNPIKSQKEKTRAAKTPKSLNQKAIAQVTRQLIFQ